MKFRVLPSALALVFAACGDDLTDIPLHIRGSPKNLGERVPRGFPLVLQGGEGEQYSEGSGRLQLATDIATHPITAVAYQ